MERSDHAKGRAKKSGQQSIHAGQIMTTTRLGVKERVAVGKALRKRLSRESHAAFERKPGLDPVQILLAQAHSRVPDLIPLRHARMLQSPFAFLRGSAAIMSADLAFTPTTGLQVQACGDMHVANFGVFASAERRLVFAINDFDETVPGPWEWDIKRLVSSAYVAAQHLGANKSDCSEAALRVASSYRERMRAYAFMSVLDVWYDTIDSERLLEALPRWARENASAIMDKARRRTHIQVLDKMTDLIDDQHRIVEQHPFIVRMSHTRQGRTMEEAVRNLMTRYFDSLAPDRRTLLMRYRIIDVAQKVVGVGSVGTRCWVILLQGRDEDDPLFLQVKEAQPSVLSPYLPPSTDAPAYQGQRVVMGQRLIQGSPDIFLGWSSEGGFDYYVRQLRDMKGGIELEPGKTKPAGLIEYCGLCGWALALAHAKSGDAATISGYLGKSDVFDQALLRFAAAYADQTLSDHAAFAEAARSGTVEAALLTD